MSNEKELFRQMEALEANDPQLLQKIEALKGQTTDAEILVILDKFAAGIAGSRLRSWLPRGTGRKLIMLGIAAATVFGVVYGQSPYWLLLLLLLPTFSPRAMGEALLFISRLRRR
jgi:hypothetical protein